MTVSDYKRIWIELIAERLEHDYSYAQIATKLKRVNFDRHGEIRLTKSGRYARQHFPSLLGLFRIRCQSLDDPMVDIANLSLTNSIDLPLSVNAN